MKYCVITDLKTVFRSQFVGVFLTHLHTKFNIPRHKQYKLNMTAYFDVP
jgi:hypothetical protein